MSHDTHTHTLTLPLTLPIPPSPSLGVLDADELKVALRSTLGVDLSRADCEQLVAAADKDGTETIDFDEFRQICHGML
jgi:Ca2+-binding EF-hand superfamily protein